jgi:hypothetical protein
MVYSSFRSGPPSRSDPAPPAPRRARPARGRGPSSIRPRVATPARASEERAKAEGRRRFEVRFRPASGSAGVTEEGRQHRRGARDRAVRRENLGSRAQVPRRGERASPLGGLAGRQPGGRRGELLICPGKRGRRARREAARRPGRGQYTADARLRLYDRPASKGRKRLRERAEESLVRSLAFRPGKGPVALPRTRTLQNFIRWGVDQCLVNRATLPLTARGVPTEGKYVADQCVRPT